MLDMDGIEVRSDASDDEVELYTAGSCHIFAIALFRLYGWTPVVLLDHQEEPHWRDPNDPDNVIPSVVHVYALDENWNLWDVRGTKRIEAMWDDTNTPEPFRETFEASGEEDLEWLVGCWADAGDVPPIDRPLMDYRDEDVREAMTCAQKVLPIKAAAESLTRQSTSPQP